MNTTSPDPIIERPWLTYTKAVVFVVPAVIIWGLALAFLVPRTKEVCQMAGLTPSDIGWIYPATFFLVEWGRALLVGGIVALVLSEFVAPRWWRRRLAVGVGIWLANVAVLSALFMLLVIVLLAAPLLAHAQ
jgi:hypothetical protein